jgi:hypothetical protein
MSIALGKQPAVLRYRVTVKRTDQAHDHDDVFSREAETEEQATADTVEMCAREGWTVDVVSVEQVDRF